MWIIILRVYPALALLASIFFLPPVFSFIPLLLTAFYTYQWLPKRNQILWARIGPLTDYFLFFALSLLFQARLGLFSILIPFPVLGALSWSLQRVSSVPTALPAQRRRPTNVSLTLFSIAILLLLVSFPLGNRTLSLASAVAITYLVVLLIIILRGMTTKPLQEEKVKLRLRAGAKGKAQVKVSPQSRIGGTVFLASDNDWVKVNPSAFYFNHSSDLGLNISVTPSLSGPSEIVLDGQAMDRWGLLRIPFTLNPVWLYVIPRARYAAWLARKYLEGSKVGILSMPSVQAALRQAARSRTGLDYSGSRPYQPGDSLKIIDWKHSIKLNELVSKEFSEFKGRTALLLVNLAATDAEEADKLAFNIITAALSLAQENIPFALAAYDQESVKLTTTTLPPRTSLVKALEVAEQMVSFVSPIKYLAPPDVARLRTNLSRLRQLRTESSEALASLLDVEYKNLESTARENPSTAALATALTKANKESNLVVISRRNHDAEALAFNLFRYGRMGHAIIEI